VKLDKKVILLTLLLAILSFSWDQPFQVFTRGACRFAKPFEGCMYYYPSFNLLPFLGNFFPRIIIFFPIFSYLNSKGHLTKKNIYFGFAALLIFAIVAFTAFRSYHEYQVNQVGQTEPIRQATSSAH